MIEQPAYDLAAARAAFAIAERCTYLNHASIAPLPRPTVDVLHRAADQLALNPTTFFAPGPQAPFGDIFTTFADELAGLIHAAGPGEVVGVSSTSLGLNLVAQALPWRSGDNVLLVDVEFPSNVYPWMALGRRGVEARLVPADAGGASVAAFAPYVDDRTRLIAVSAVQFFTGHRADLAALGAFCRERGILLAVDAIQAAGHMPIDVQAMQIDILAAGGQKSLMAPPGWGFLYVRDEVCAESQPTTIGPNATEDWEHWLKYDARPRRGAARFMTGTTNVLGMLALVESVRFLRGLGLAAIDAWTQHLSRVAIEDLTARGWDVITPAAHLGPIVTFRVGNGTDLSADEARAAALLRYLNEHGVYVTKHWDAARRPHLRVSTHCYNTEDEVRRVGALLAEMP